MGTETPPGSPERIRYYMSRFNKTFNQTDDLKEDDRRTPLLTRARNGRVLVKSEIGGLDVPLPETLPSRIRVLCRICGLSQGQLAKELDVSKRAVRFWIQGKRTPGLPMLKKLALVFRITVGKLCD